MAAITVLYAGTAWRGYLEHGVLRFDFKTNEGRAIRFFTLPDKCVMLAHRPWDDSIAPYMEWFVHLVDVCEHDRERDIWKVIDREIDIIVEKDLQTYRVIDLEDFGAAVEKRRISLTDARRLLIACQRFLDECLHGGGRFPPREIRPWLGDLPQPQRLVLDIGE